MARTLKGKKEKVKGKNKERKPSSAQVTIGILHNETLTGVNVKAEGLNAGESNHDGNERSGVGSSRSYTEAKTTLPWPVRGPG
jgi:hypothetical protein